MGITSFTLTQLLSKEAQRLIAEALGVDTSGQSDAVAAEAAARAVEELVAELGQPARLSEVGVGSGQFEEIAEGVLQDLVVAGSPIRIESAAQVVSILEAAA